MTRPRVGQHTPWMQSCTSGKSSQPMKRPARRSSSPSRKKHCNSRNHLLRTCAGVAEFLLKSREFIPLVGHCPAAVASRSSPSYLVDGIWVLPVWATGSFLQDTDKWRTHNELPARRRRTACRSCSPALPGSFLLRVMSVQVSLLQQ